MAFVRSFLHFLLSFPSFISFLPFFRPSVLPSFRSSFPPSDYNNDITEMVAMDAEKSKYLGGDEEHTHLVLGKVPLGSLFFKICERLDIRFPVN
jgi:hypothetical protein